MNLRERLPARISRGIFLFASRAFNSLAGLLFSLVAGRFLTVEDHGVFAAGLARMVIAQAILEAGLQYSMVRYLAPAIREGALAEIRNLVRASLVLKMLALILLGVLTAGTAVLLSVFTGPQFLREILPDSGAPVLLWLIFLGGAAMSFVSYQEAVLVAHGSYNKLSAWLPSTGLFRLLLLFAFYLADESFSARQVLFAYALGPVLSAACFFFIFPAEFFFQRTREWRGRLKLLVSYNAFIVAASFFSIFSDWMEVLMLSESSETGIYNAARMPLQGFLIFLATMQSLLLPRFAGLSSRDEYFAAFKSIYAWLLPAAILLVPGLFVLAWFIPYWFGPQYHDSVTVLYLLYPGYLLKILFAPLGTALFALDRPRLIAVEAGARMIAGFGLNLWLIPAHGIFGAAAAGFAAPFAGWIFLIFCYTRFYKTGEFPLPEKVHAE